VAGILGDTEADPEGLVGDEGVGSTGEGSGKEARPLPLEMAYFCEF